MGLESLVSFSVKILHVVGLCTLHFIFYCGNLSAQVRRLELRQMLS